MVKTNIVVYGFKKWTEAHDYAEKHGIKNPSYGWDMAKKHYLAYPGGSLSAYIKKRR